MRIAIIVALLFVGVCASAAAGVVLLLIIYATRRLYMASVPMKVEMVPAPLRAEELEVEWPNELGDAEFLDPIDALEVPDTDESPGVDGVPFDEASLFGDHEHERDVCNASPDVRGRVGRHERTELGPNPIEDAPFEMPDTSSDLQSVEGSSVPKPVIRVRRSVKLS